MLQGEIHLIGPFLYQRDHKDHRKDSQNAQDNKGRNTAADTVPDPVLFHFNLGDLCIAHIVPFQIFQQGNADNGGDQHHHSYYSAPVEIGDTAQHLIVENRSYYFVLSSHRSRNTVIRKAEEEALYHGSRKSSQKRPDNSLPESLERIVPHNPGHDHKLFVNESHGV